MAHVIERTLTATPADATHWSLRSISGLSHTTIRRIWTAFGLQPHRSERFTSPAIRCSSTKVRDIIGLYLAPPDRAVVLCVDEKSQIQALDPAASVADAPGMAERRTPTYGRHGTTSLFAALDVPRASSSQVLQACIDRDLAL